MNMNSNLWLTLQCDQGNTWCTCCQWVTNIVWYLQKQSQRFNLDYHVIDWTGAVLITIQFIRAVDNGLKVSMRITDKIYSILLAEEGPRRSEKGAISISHSSHYRKCLHWKVGVKNTCIFLNDFNWFYDQPLTFLPGGHTARCSRPRCLLLHFRHSG